MSIVQARLQTRFANWLHGLSGSEMHNMEARPGDIRLINNKAQYREPGDARQYPQTGVWVRDLPAPVGIKVGSCRLVHSQVSRDADEPHAGFPGDVDMYGIGNPHRKDGRTKASVFDDIKRLIK